MILSENVFMRKYSFLGLIGGIMGGLVYSASVLIGNIIFKPFFVDIRVSLVFSMIHIAFSGVCGLGYPFFLHILTKIDFYNSKNWIEYKSALINGVIYGILTWFIIGISSILIIQIGMKLYTIDSFDLLIRFFGSIGFGITTTGFFTYLMQDFPFTDYLASISVRQKIASIIPIILIPSMLIMFQLFSILFDSFFAWFIGLAVYWVVFGLIITPSLIGWSSLKRLITPCNFDNKVLALVLGPLIIAFLARIVGWNYENDSALIYFLYLITAFGNGFFEEVFWRGVYLNLASENIFYQTIWPSLLFGLWHLAPGIVSSTNVFRLVVLIVGAIFLGFYLSTLARKTNTIWWSIVTHTLGGLILVL